MSMAERLYLDECEEDSGAADSTSQDGLKLLVVDDNPGDRTFLALLLRQVACNVEVECVSSGEAALEQLSSAAFDCVLLDYHLGDGEATPYLEQFAELHRWTPVIVFSGAGSEDKAVRAMQLGAADYLIKGRVTAQALGRSISNAITKSTLLHSLDKERRELLKANAVLRKQRREIQSFYHTVSHELKTPITAVREFCSLISDGILGEVNTQQRDALTTSVGCCDRLTRLVNDLFDAARVETGKLELNLTTIDLSRLLQQEVEIMHSQAQERGIMLCYNAVGPLPTLQGDANRLSQVICNLLSNAIKYTDGGGKVIVEARYDSVERAVAVSVADNGYGIASEHAEFIFDRLYQCEDIGPDGESSHNGMGIGLYLCHQIVQLHKGEISVSSKLGEGSTFTFTLPVWEEAS